MRTSVALTTSTSYFHLFTVCVFLCICFSNNSSFMNFFFMNLFFINLFFINLFFMSFYLPSTFFLLKVITKLAFQNFKMFVKRLFDVVFRFFPTEHSTADVAQTTVIIHSSRCLTDAQEHAEQHGTIEK